MKTILYIRTAYVGFKALFTRENAKEILIGTLIGQLIGWAFVAGMFLTGCSKSEDTNVPAEVVAPVVEPPVCEAPIEMWFRLSSLSHKSEKLQIEIDELAVTIKALTRAQANAKNSIAYYHLGTNINRVEEKHEDLVLELASVKFEIFELQDQINSYECK